MQTPTRQVHVTRADRRIQVAELQPQPPGMLRLNPCLRSRLEEPFNASMPEALDHGAVYRVTIHVARWLEKIATLPQGARTDLSPIGEMSQGHAASRLNVGKRSVEHFAGALHVAARNVQKFGGALL